MSIFKFSKKSDEEKNSSSSKTESTNLDDGQSSENLILIEEKKDMIKGIEDLSETSVKEVMIPRIDVDFISIDTPQEELLQKIAESQGIFCKHIEVETRNDFISQIASCSQAFLREVSAKEKFKKV